MDARDKWRLRRNRVELLDIDTDEACPHLVQDGILTPDDVERIKCQTTSKDKTEALLNMIEGKGTRAYAAVKDTLSKLDRDDLVQKLAETDMTKLPAKLKKELEGTDKADDSPDRGNMIKTNFVPNQKRAVSVKDECFTHQSNQAKQQKTLHQRTKIIVTGDNNFVSHNSAITLNNYNEKEESK